MHKIEEMPKLQLGCNNSNWSSNSSNRHSSSNNRNNRRLGCTAARLRLNRRSSGNKAGPRHTGTALRRLLGNTDNRPSRVGTTHLLQDLDKASHRTSREDSKYPQSAATCIQSWRGPCTVTRLIVQTILGTIPPVSSSGWQVTAWKSALHVRPASACGLSAAIQLPRPGRRRASSCPNGGSPVHVSADGTHKPAHRAREGASPAYWSTLRPIPYSTSSVPWSRCV